MRRLTGFDVGKKGAGYQPLAWPAYTFSQWRDIQPPVKWPEISPIPWDLESNGQELRIKSSGTHRVSDLGLQGLSKRIRVHPVYAQAIVAVPKGTTTIDGFVRNLGYALGAAVLSKPDGYTLDLDVKTFRPLLLEALRQGIARRRTAGEKEVRLAAMELSRSVFANLSDPVFRRAVELTEESEGLFVEVSPQSPVMPAVFAYLRAYASRTDFANAPLEGPSSPRGMVERMDLDRPIKLAIDGTTFKVGVQAWEKGTRGGAIRL